VTVFAAIRPHDIDLVLLFHVLGAMVLVGALITASGMAIIGWSDASDTLRRLSYRVLLFVAFPGYIVMRIFAQWVESKEHLDNLKDDPTWLGIGYMAADIGGLLLLIALIVGGIGARKARSGGGTTLLRVSSVIATLLVAVYVVAVWAMGGKPA
jgi:hypothetical protein